jgi:two-component system, sensor histidine kinase YesM
VEMELMPRRPKGLIYRYLRAIILLLFLPIFLVTSLIFNEYKKDLTVDSFTRVHNTNLQIAATIDNEISKASLAAATISNDDTLIDLLTAWNHESDLQNKYRLSKQIDTRLNYFFNYNVVESIVFYFYDQNFYFFRGPPAAIGSEAQTKTWYRSALRNPGQVNIHNSFQSDIPLLQDRNTLSLSIKPDLPKLRSDIDCVYFAFKSTAFQQWTSDPVAETGGDILVADADRNIILSSNRSFIGTNLITSYKELVHRLDNHSNDSIVTVSGRKKLLSFQELERTNWTIISLIDYQWVNSKVDRIFYKILIYTFGFSVVFLIFSMYFLRDIILPIKKLMSIMKKVEGGNFKTTIESKGSLEVVELGRTFNRMVGEISTLMEERDRKEKLRLEAEIDALQSQINPHFMSNTLNAIRFMAMISKVESIEKMTEAFIKILNATFVKKSKWISISEEMEHLESYLYIMNIRYGNTFDFQINVESEILCKRIIRLTLQPILENALLHGISDVDRRGILLLTGRQTDRGVLFEIRDNGIGLSQDQIDQLLLHEEHHAKGFTGMGIRNVDRRIKLNHGLDYGLTITSEINQYTLVRVLLPDLPLGEEEDHA